MSEPINQEHEEVLNFAHSLPSGLTQEQIYVRIHERARAIPPAAAAAGLPAGWVPAPVIPTDAMVLAPGALHTSGNVARIHREIWHRMLMAAPALPADPVDESQPAAPDEWKPNQGAIPVAENTRVRVMLRDGYEGEDVAGKYRWEIYTKSSPLHFADIIKWRIAPAMEAQSHADQA